MNIQLYNSYADGGDAVGDVLTSIENLTGSGFADRLYGNAENNVLIGGDGDDRLRGREGADTLLGGAGGDTLDGGAGADILDGGDGWDTVNFSSTAVGVTVNLATGVGSGGEAEGDAYSSIEAISATNANDVLIGDAGNNSLFGGGGDDLLQGGDGNDLLVGGQGADQLQGGDGNDVYAFYAGDGADVITDAGGAADVVQFYQTAASDLWFSQEGNNLVVSTLGTQDKISVTNWFSDPAAQIETIYDTTGAALYAGDVNNLISQMAQFSAQVGGDPSAAQPSQLPPEYAVAVNAVWHSAG